MIYPNLTFPNPEGRPYYYSNFVQTIDGKVQVITEPKAYWPIGSKTDYQVLLELRAYADVLIHGKHTAKVFATVKSLGRSDFQNLRKQVGRKGPITYVVLSSQPDEELLKQLIAPSAGVETILVTTEEVVINEISNNQLTVLRLGKQKIDLIALDRYFAAQGYQQILVEGGPTLLGTFLVANLIDELFVTIAPKIIGNETDTTLSMVEGVLFPPDQIKHFQLLSAKLINDEVYLRYQSQRKSS